MLREEKQTANQSREQGDHDHREPNRASREVATKENKTRTRVGARDMNESRRRSEQRRRRRDLGFSQGRNKLP
ncbi:hypothetical protein U1Q18_018592 [Sarracenia purpurea var. burkii]